MTSTKKKYVLTQNQINVKYPDLPKCGVCLTNTQSILLACGHACLCRPCVTSIKINTNKCPFCIQPLKIRSRFICKKTYLNESELNKLNSNKVNIKRIKNFRYCSCGEYHNNNEKCSCGLFCCVNNCKYKSEQYYDPDSDSDSYIYTYTDTYSDSSSSGSEYSDSDSEYDESVLSSSSEYDSSYSESSYSEYDDSEYDDSESSYSESVSSSD